MLHRRLCVCVNARAGTLGCEGALPGLLQETGPGLLGGLGPPPPPAGQGRSLLSVLPSIPPSSD